MTRKNYYKEGNVLYPQFDATKAYRKAIKTWGRWIDNNVDRSKLIIYRGYSAAHFRCLTSGLYIRNSTFFSFILIDFALEHSIFKYKLLSTCLFSEAETGTLVAHAMERQILSEAVHF